jgi:hypothetical protein
MQHSGWDAEGISRKQLHRRSTFQLYPEHAIENEEELVLFVMLVPVELSLQTPKRTTTSPTCKSVWLYQGSCTASISAWTFIFSSVRNKGSYRMS